VAIRWVRRIVGTVRAHSARGLRPLDHDIWVAEAPLRFFVEMGRRMTVVRVGEDGLLVHSPVPLSEDLRRQLLELGTVRFVVPASNLHGHRFMEQYREAFPGVELFAAPGLARKRRDLSFDADLSEHPDPRWADVLDQAVFRGHRLLDEIVFFHEPSRSLIVGDLCFNIEADAPLATRLWAWGPRLRQRVGPAPLFRAAVRDKQAARDSIERILSWPFDRLVVGHGAIIESGGRDALRSAWAWLGV
jgi:hypothetical protein